MHAKRRTIPVPVTIVPSVAPPQEEKVEVPESTGEESEGWVDGWSFPKLFLASSAASALIFLVFRSVASYEAWPSPGELEEAVMGNPETYSDSSDPFVVNQPPYKWELVPVASWDHSFLVASSIPPRKWTQVSIPGRHDFVSSDMTCLWGDNARLGLYRGVDFGNTETAGFAMGTKEGWKTTEFSYNILIPANPEVDAAIKRAERGDQCRVVGTKVTCHLLKGDGGRIALVNRSEEDVSVPAVIYVREFLFLRKHNQVWRILSETFMWLSLSLFALAAVAQMLPSDDGGA